MICVPLTSSLASSSPIPPCCVPMSRRLILASCTLRVFFFFFRWGIFKVFFVYLLRGRGRFVCFHLFVYADICWFVYFVIKLFFHACIYNFFDRQFVANAIIVKVIKCCYSCVYIVIIAVLIIMIIISNAILL